MLCFYCPRFVFLTFFFSCYAVLHGYTTKKNFFLNFQVTVEHQKFSIWLECPLPKIAFIIDNLSRLFPSINNLNRFIWVECRYFLFLKIKGIFDKLVLVPFILPFKFDQNRYVRWERACDYNDDNSWTKRIVWFGSAIMPGGKIKLKHAIHTK